MCSASASVFSEGLRRLAALDTTERVAAPFIDVEA
jgi:hypothetical protein